MKANELGGFLLTQGGIEVVVLADGIWLPVTGTRIVPYRRTRVGQVMGLSFTTEKIHDGQPAAIHGAHAGQDRGAGGSCDSPAHPTFERKRSVFHPILKMRARHLAAQQIANERDIRPLRALQLVRGIDEETFAVCMSNASDDSNVIPMGTDGVGAIGDGTIIQAIIDWLRSEEGQAFIAALVKIILSLLAV